MTSSVTLGECDGCGYLGVAVRRGRLTACPICAVELVEALHRRVKTSRSHTAILMGQQLLARAGQPLAAVLRELGERLR